MRAQEFSRLFRWVEPRDESPWSTRIAAAANILRAVLGITFALAIMTSLHTLGGRAALAATDSALRVNPRMLALLADFVMLVLLTVPRPERSRGLAILCWAAAALTFRATMGAAQDCHCLGWLGQSHALVYAVWTLTSLEGAILAWLRGWSWKTADACACAIAWAEVLVVAVLLLDVRPHEGPVSGSIVQLTRTGTTESGVMRVHNLGNTSMTVKEINASCECLHVTSLPPVIPALGWSEVSYTMEHRENWVRPTMSLVIEQDGETSVFSLEALPPN